MKLSIITVSFNSSKTIEETINSVDSQSYRDFEHLIIDGNSTDGTLDILNRYESSKRRIISENDKGLYDAMNKGIALSKGEYIFFLNADDYLANVYALEIIAQDIDDHSSDILMYSIEYFGDGMTRKWLLKDRKEVFPSRAFVPPHPGFVIRAETIKRNNLTFDLNYTICADMKFMLEAIQILTAKKFTSSRILIKMRKGGVSSSNIFGRIKEYYRIYKDLGHSSHTRIIFIFMRYWNRVIQQFK